MNGHEKKQCIGSCKNEGLPYYKVTSGQKICTDITGGMPCIMQEDGNCELHTSLTCPGDLVRETVNSMLLCTEECNENRYSHTGVCYDNCF